MAHTDIALPTATWTLITDTNVTALRVQNVGADIVLLQATSGATAPTSSGGAVCLIPGEGIAADQTLADLFPGVASAARVWARPLNAVSKVSVSHA